MSQRAVIVTIRRPGIALKAVHALEDALIEAPERTDVGELDGDDGASTRDAAHIYLDGPNAPALWAAILPVLAAEPLVQGADALLRYREKSNAPEAPRTLPSEPAV